MNDFQNLKLQEGKLRTKADSFGVKGKNDILDALDLAKKAHEGQKRDEGIPYVIHPIRVANTLMYDLSSKGVESIVSGLLHDVVEDTNVTLAEIEKRFGKKVADTVLSLTRDKKKETKKEKFEKTLQKEQRIKLLKACDWLDNLRSLAYWTDRGEKWQRHLQEAKEMYIPLAKATENKWLIGEMEKAYDKVLRTHK